LRAESIVIEPLINAGYPSEPGQTRDLSRSQMLLGCSVILRFE